MTWLLTIQGREHHMAGIGQQLNTPTVSEIAHALAQINRFTGHAKRPYSVAEHSLFVANLAADDGASPVVQLAALMHDAHEAYCGDMASPAKLIVGESWHAFEHSQAMALHNTMGLRSTMHAHRAAIRRWDLIALATERRDLTTYDAMVHMPWPILHGLQPHPEHRLSTNWREAMSWTDWRRDFEMEHERLTTLVHAQAEAA